MNEGAQGEGRVSDHPTCLWIRTLLAPAGLAAVLASLAGLVWWAGVMAVDMETYQGPVWMFILLYPTYLFAFAVAEGREVDTVEQEEEPEDDPLRNVTVYDPPRFNFEDRFDQIRHGPNPAWRERAQPSLPAGITARELQEWLFLAKEGKATFAARDSRRGKGGRSLGYDDDVTSTVKGWLDVWRVIDVDGSGHWSWGEMADLLFDALARGEGFGVLIPPTESEV